jgi:hypothetical protein
MKTNPKSKLNLTRFSYESTGFKGWRVSVTRHGEVFTRYFSDRQFGSMKKSQEAAQKCLAALLSKIDATPVVTTRRKPTGKQAGVTEQHLLKPGSSEAKVSWIASWPEDGRRKVVKFPVAKYGARKAKQMALDARRKAEERLGLNLSYHFRKEDAKKLRDFLANF